MKPNRIIICETCGQLEADKKPLLSAEQFRNEINTSLDSAGILNQFDVSTVACMGACEEPIALALQGNKKATYLFSSIDPKTDLPDIVATCQTFLDAPLGWIEDARPCGRLRDCLRSRVPSFDTP